MNFLKSITGILMLSIFMVGCHNDDQVLQEETLDYKNIATTSKNSVIRSNVKIMTYNTHLFLITRYDDVKRQAAVINFINQHTDNDIIVFSEVWSDAAKREIVSDLRLTYPYSVHTETSGATVGDGLLVISKFPINRSSFEKFDDEAGIDALSDKGFWELEIATAEGAAFYLYGTHMQSGSSHRTVRGKQLDQIKKKMKAKHDAGYAVVLAGDLNVSADTDEYRINIKEKFTFLRDPVPSASGSAYITYDKPFNKLAEEFDGNGLVQERLDYILMSKTSFQGRVGQTNMYRPKYQSTNDGTMDVSDHYPFETGLILSTRKTSVAFNVYDTWDQASTARQTMKDNYGNGVSALTIISNNTDKFLTFKEKISLHRGGFYTNPPGIIPPGKKAAFLAVHPQGESLGVDNSVRYYIGGNQHYFSVNTSVPWGASPNAVDGAINANLDPSENPRGKNFSKTSNGYTLTGTIGNGTSLGVHFIISN